MATTSRHLYELNTGSIRIAMIQDFAELILPKALVRIAKIDRAAPLQVRVGSSVELLGQLAGGLHDIVLCLGTPDDPAAIASVKMAWLGHVDLCIERRLPVALMEKPCIFRDAAVTALEASGRDYKVVLETPSIAVLRAAVQGGIALTCRTPFFVGDDLLRLAQFDHCLPEVAYCLHTCSAPTSHVIRIAQIIRNAVLLLEGGKRDLQADWPASAVAVPAFSF